MLAVNKRETTGPAFTEGWHELTIVKAIDGTHNGSRYIDLFFVDHPESLKCRVWSNTNRETGEEFGLSNLFYHANAGVTEDDSGNTFVDDNATLLRGKRVNVLFYRKENGYTECVSRIAPVAQETDLVTFTEDDVRVEKSSVLNYHERFTRPTTANGATTTNGTDEAVHF